MKSTSQTSSAPEPAPVHHQWIETPREDLFIVRTGNLSPLPQPSERSRAPQVLDRLGKALATPGISRDAIFRGGGKRVYAYSISPKNPAMIIREDASGNKTLGHFTAGRFRALRTGKAAL